MNRSMFARLLPLLSLPFWLVPAPRAQDPAAAAAAAERLQRLLQELNGIDPATWAARRTALEAAAKAHDERASALRADAAKLVEQAAQQEAAAKAVRAELLRLLELEKLLGAKAAPSAAVPATAPQAEPAPKPAQPPSPTRNEPKPADEAGTPMPVAAAVEPPKKAAEPATAPTTDATPLVTWKSHIGELLQDRCSSCHEPGDRKGGLDVSSFAAVRKGGGSGASIVPGEPEQSRLYRLVAQLERPFMPRGEDPLGKADVELLQRWIEQGAAEDDAGARGFLQAKAAAAAKASSAPAARPATTGAMPTDLPAVALRAPSRPRPVKSLARSPNAALLALPGQQQLLLLDGTGKLLAVAPIDAAVVDAVAFAPDGSQFVVAAGQPGRSGRALVHDVRTGRQIAAIGSERDVPLAVALHAGKGLVSLGGAGKHTRVFALGADGTAAERWHAQHADFVLGLSFAPDGALLAAADRGGNVLLYETATGRLAETLAGHTGAVHAVAFASDGRLLVTAGADGTVRGFDPNSGKETWRQNAHQGEAFAVAFGPGELLASCGSDGRIKVWTKAGRNVATSPDAGEWLYALAFGDTDEQLHAGDWQGRVHHFATKGKERTMPFSVPLQPAQ